MTRVSRTLTRLKGPRAALRLTLAVSATALLGACQNALDYDLRGQLGGFNTSSAAKTATANPPSPDDRGLITYPSYQVAVARRGDTLDTVAARIGLPASEIANFNGMKPSDPLREGEIVALPRRAPDIASGVTQPGSVDIASLAGNAIDSAESTSPNPGSVTTTTLAPTKRAEPAKVQDGPEPVRHKVVRGETAYTISRLYQVPVKSLADWNNLGSDFSIREGQYLLIPVKNSPPPAAAAATAVTAPGEGSATPTPPSATKPLPTQQVAPAAQAVAEKPTVDVPAPTRSSDAPMAYPVQGRIIRTYAKGKNDGIDIAAAPGTHVKAAEAGEVVAITKDSENVPIIVIRHDPKLLTVYANVGGIAVKKGQQVKRGQKIAELREGDSAFLHFEVRNGFESLDPLDYLN